jgi:hypothetical protein
LHVIFIKRLHPGSETKSARLSAELAIPGWAQTRAPAIAFSSFAHRQTVRPNPIGKLGREQLFFFLRTL